MNITRGKIAKAQKVVIYGVEGIGKSTLAAKFPDPVFIDIEGSTGNMNVARFDKPTSYSMLMNQIAYVNANPDICKTLVIDTVDWAEKMAIEMICAAGNKTDIAQFGYGEGFIKLEQEIGRFLNKLSDLVDKGINVILIAHAIIRKFEQPDELGAYDRYELKLGNKTTGKTAALVKEWSDLLLFCNYKTHVFATDDKGKKHKAQGGERTVYAEHHPAWDAKNRHGLPFEMPMDWNQISHIFIGKPESEEKPQVTVPKEPVEENKVEIIYSDYIPKEVQDLMNIGNVTVKELSSYWEKAGHFPAGMIIENIPAEYWKSLVAHWANVVSKIKAERI